jgi:pimeloyl-ACP methyl ester carboxylesterase
MSKLPLLILHGWSADSKSLEPLSAFLKKSGFNVVDIWLADYLSMNDEITIQDLGQAMGKALEKNNITVKPKSFDVIVHSTGGLVIRQYLLHYFYGRPDECPVKRLVMLAPANFGSPLAHMGKSMIGRLKTGWDWDHLFQSGTKVLDALELASPITWQMAESDLFDPENKIFSPQNLFTTILVGTDAYAGLAGTIHENGSDGTVRVSTANLNASYIKLSFENDEPVVSEKERAYDPIAFSVLYKQNHGTITRPDLSPSLADILIKSLSIETSSEYQKHVEALNETSNRTFEKGLQNESIEKRYHQYQHVVSRVRDQFGEFINDYFLEFFQEEKDKNDNVMQKMQSETLEKVWPYSRLKSYRSFHFDVTDMKKEILDKGKHVDMSICAAALSKHITYLDPKKYIPMASKTENKLLRPNTTLMMDITLPRIQGPEVFKFRKA